MSGFMLTLAAAFSWACGNIFNKKIMQHSPRPAVMSLVVWSALIPILPFLLSSLLLEGGSHYAKPYYHRYDDDIVAALSGFCRHYTWLRHLGHVTGAL